jgi:RNA polymerase sigma-70 factor (ECF subfamily)
VVKKEEGGIVFQERFQCDIILESEPLNRSINPVSKDKLTMSSLQSSGATRQSLISRALAQQGDAWSELIDLYGPLVAHWCRRFGCDSHATADSVQDVFTAVYRSLGRYEASERAGSFRAWLWTITANKLRDRLRAERHHHHARGGSSAMIGLHSIADPYNDDVALSDQDPTSTDELAGLMARAMEQVRSEFEPKTWDMFIRSVVDQLPTQVVAAQYGVTEAAVRKNRSRIMRRLRQQLGDAGDHSSRRMSP